MARCKKQMSSSSKRRCEDNDSDPPTTTPTRTNRHQRGKPGGDTANKTQMVAGVKNSYEATVVLDQLSERVALSYRVHTQENLVDATRLAAKPFINSRH